MKLIFGFLATVQCAGINAQTIPAGRVLEGLEMKSAILGKPVRFAVYLPPDYETATRRYPVVYLLHGYTDQEWAWIQFGEANLAADRAIAAREVPPMIIVMPDGGVSFYINNFSGKVRWEDMFVQEFIPFIDAQYRTRPQKEFSGISGLSMGGYGALHHAMKHPDLFAACASFSAGIRTDEEIIARPDEEYDRGYGPLFGAGLKGEARLTDHYRQNNPLDLAQALPPDSLKAVRFYIDCGDDDFLIRGNCMLHLILRDREVSHEFRVRDGAHNWTYWRTGITDGLKFIGESFNR